MRTYIFALCICLLCTSCGASDLLSTIDGAIIAAEAVLPMLSNEIPPALATPLMRYLQDADQGLSCATAELQTTDSQSVQGSKIAVCLANVIAPELPAGIPQTVVNLINKIAQSIARLKTTAKTARATGGTTTATLKVSAKEASKIKALNQRASANYRTARVWLTNNPPKQ